MRVTMQDDSEDESAGDDNNDNNDYDDVENDDAENDVADVDKDGNVSYIYNTKMRVSSTLTLLIYLKDPIELFLRHPTHRVSLK